MKTERCGKFGMLAVGGAACMLLASQGLAQTGVRPPAQAPATPSKPSATAPATTTPPVVTDSPGVDSTLTGPRGTLVKLSRPMTIELTDQRLEDVITFIAEFTGANLEPMWAVGGQEGLNKDTPITLSVRNRPALDVLEQVLTKAQSDFGANTWQFTSYGAIEIGPKDLLNKHKRVELYDIKDLLFVIPSYTEVPSIDLQGLLQQSQNGGGGGQSPFRDQQQNRVKTPEQVDTDLQKKTEEVVGLITSLIEPEQWADNGGEGGTIRAFQGNIIVNAPDYLQRQVGGYKFWGGASGLGPKTVAGKRYVSLNMDTGIGKVDGVQNFPVTAVVGGRVVRSDGGGGGNVAPGGNGNPPVKPKK